MSASVRITAPSRIHFGLLSLHPTDVHPDARRFGGAGVMVEQPSTEIVARKAETTTISGPLAGRVERFIETWAQSTGMVRFLPDHGEKSSSPSGSSQEGPLL